MQISNIILTAILNIPFVLTKRISGITLKNCHKTDMNVSTLNTISTAINAFLSPIIFFTEKKATIGTARFLNSVKKTVTNIFLL